MAQTLEERLLGAIKADDLDAFHSAADRGKLGGYRLGRFPVLSLMYMYGARKLIAAHEAEFLRIAVWEPLREPAEAAALFYEKAGKCLRLYFDEVVSPLEMLLIMDKTTKVKKFYPIVKPSDAVKKRLRSIYYIRYKLRLNCSGNSVTMQRRPLRGSEKVRLAFACIGALLALAIIIATPVTLTKLIPSGAVFRLGQIDFSSQKSYTLMKDITLPDGFDAVSMNCTINGGGKRLIMGKNASLGEMSGKLSDIEIVTSGTPVFTRCTYTSEVTGVTVNVIADELEISSSVAFVTPNNFGLIDSVTVNVSGSVRVAGGEDVVLCGMVLNNYKTLMSQSVYGTIRNCKVNYNNFRLQGDLASNASFGGIAGNNDSVISDCEVNGSVTSDTFDLAGVCYNNSYLISGCTSRVRLTQASSNEQWSSKVGGIAIGNSGEISDCLFAGEVDAKGANTAIGGGFATENSGNIRSCTNEGSVTTSASETAISGGFAMENSGNILYCTYGGEVTASSDQTALSGGIAAQNVTQNGFMPNGKCLIMYCTVEGAVSASADETVLCGGIAAQNLTYIGSCESKGDISATGAGDARCGGIAADNYRTIEGCVFSGSLTASAAGVYAGGICGITLPERSDNTIFVGTGIVRQCISGGSVCVTVGEGDSCVGGVVGAVQSYNTSDGMTVGGCVNDCIFTGELTGDHKAMGSIVGAARAEHYESNGYDYDQQRYTAFDGNVYAASGRTAFGEIIDSEGKRVPAADKGARSDTLENILSSELYGKIMAGLMPPDDSQSA